ncbi:MAG: DUF4830 domain-containing protein [Clostridia bacterium]|nr:DUF4830 domain-containing protein [Clostridia bacterium]
MFVYSVQSKHIKALALGVFVLFTVVSLMVLSRESKMTSNDGSLNLKASTHEDRMSFVSQFGWEVEEDPIEIKEIIIPTEFDDTYNAYNQIQKEQGFDLTEYAGERAKRWTYIVKNYEGYENKECIHINILVHDEIVIGGDVCSVELEGFMHGFSKP